MRTKPGRKETDLYVFRAITSVEPAQQPGLCDSPVPLDGDRSHVEDFRDLILLKSTEEAELFNLSGTGLQLRQLSERIVESNQICFPFFRPSFSGSQRESDV